ncbi:MAG: AbrB/MazE/SpoVT family DNA-binding domain-containing protein, partial [Candidatus Bathyarchaeota archaeon]|nr:AbrB/MazE/SpoVT family DNA-binding domain-containing protein [Candidatus Bathyarchaeota archaeon]
IKRNGKSYMSYRITLPKDLVEALSYSECEEVSVEASMTEDGEIVIIVRKCPQQGSRALLA